MFRSKPFAGGKPIGSKVLASEDFIIQVERYLESDLERYFVARCKCEPPLHTIDVSRGDFSSRLQSSFEESPPIAKIGIGITVPLT